MILISMYLLRRLRSLMAKSEYTELSLQDKSVQGAISDCWDGQLYKQHPLLSDSSKFTVAIQLFYDGMGTTNPLRGQSSMCNVGVFHFVVKNLPNAFNSCFANVHLVALCYSSDVKTYGFGAILCRFVGEMKRLGDEGYVNSWESKFLCHSYKLPVTTWH